MKRTIVFENPGEIDPVAICTFGVSVKEGDNPIGFFGTGLKYALAILLRNGHEVMVQSGEREHRFGLRKATVRGQEFDLVTMDDHDLGFTTHLGAKWEMWMAYRELHCNCLDEGGKSYELQMPEVGRPTPTTGRTRVLVTGDAFAEAHDCRGSFLLQTTPIRLLNDVVELHPSPGHGLFFKGILVHVPKGERTARYTYNLRSGVDLTEDRTAKFPSWDWDVVRDAMRMCDDEALLREMLTLSNVYHEAMFDYNRALCGSADKASPAFFRAVEALTVDRVAEINSSAVELYKRLRATKIEPTSKPLSAIEEKQLARAIEFCRGLGFTVDDYPITVVESLGYGILGIAVRDVQQIYIAAQAFDKGTKCVAGTLIEEWCHLKHRLIDETREMQNWLLDRLVGLGELAQGEPL